MIFSERYYIIRSSHDIELLLVHITDIVVNEQSSFDRVQLLEYGSFVLVLNDNSFDSQLISNDDERRRKEY
jgi:hypothetical protein